MSDSFGDVKTSSGGLQPVVGVSAVQETPAPRGLLMSLDRFSASVPVGSVTRIWIGPLRNAHGTEIHSKAEWLGLVEALKSQPVSFDNLRRVAAPGS